MDKILKPKKSKADLSGNHEWRDKVKQMKEIYKKMKEK